MIRLAVCLCVSMCVPIFSFAQSPLAKEEWSSLYNSAIKHYELKQNNVASELIDSFIQIRLQENILLAKGILLKVSIEAEADSSFSAKPFFSQVNSILTNLPEASENYGFSLLKEGQGDFYRIRDDYKEAIRSYEAAIDFRFHKSHVNYDYLSSIFNKKIDVALQYEEYNAARKFLEEILIVLPEDFDRDSYASYIALLDERGYELNYDRVRQERSEYLQQNILKEYLLAIILVVLTLLLSGILYVRGKESRFKIYDLILSKRKGNLTSKADEIEEVLTNSDYSKTDSPTDAGQKHQPEQVAVLELKSEKDKTDVKQQNLLTEKLISQLRKAYPLSKERSYLGHEIVFLRNGECPPHPVLTTTSEPFVRLVQKPTLKRIREIHLSKPLFYPVSRSAIVNISKIDFENSFHQPYFVIMTSGDKVLVSQNRWNKFKWFCLNEYRPVSNCTIQNLSRTGSKPVS